jgi:hypothetical protein
MPIVGEVGVTVTVEAACADPIAACPAMSATPAAISAMNPLHRSPVTGRV